MKKFRIIIEDEEKAKDAFIESYRLFPKLQAEWRKKRDEIQRSKGSVIAEIKDFDCPIGKPNCRNCGDPAFESQCKAKGHCSMCGIEHGVASDGTMAKNGYKIEEI